jgi:hypothetical protein
MTIFWAPFLIFVLFRSYINIKVLKEKKFYWVSIGGDTIFPLSLRLSGIEFSLVSDLAKLGSA